MVIRLDKILKAERLLSFNTVIEKSLDLLPKWKTVNKLVFRIEVASETKDLDPITTLQFLD